MEINKGDIIRGYVHCGEGNPFFNEMVELEVTSVWTRRYDGKICIEVVTVEKRAFNHCIIDIRTSTVEEEWVEMNHYSHFLDTSKPYEIIKHSNTSY